MRKAAPVLALAAAAAGTDNGLGRRPPLGWNTWETCGDAQCTHDACTEAEVKRNAQAMLDSGMHDLGWRYVNLDDCWAAPRAADGGLTWDAGRFPSGIPALADWLHQRGLLFGLYTSAGNQTCSNGGRPFRVPGSRGHYDQDAASFAAWGVDYVKLDWCGDIHNQILQGKKAHEDFARAMNASGRPMFLEVVAGYWFMQGGISTVANSWRFCEDHHDSWEKTEEQLLCREALAKSARGSPGGWAYMDFLMTGGAGCARGSHCPGMTDDAYRTEFVLWSLTQSPLIVATDLTNMTAVMRAALLNKELIDLHQMTDTPPGRRLANWPCEQPISCQVWGRQLSRDGRDWLVALVNLGSKHHKITAEWAHLAWDSAATASCRDLWAHADLPAVSGSFTADVPPHGTTVVRLTTQ
eukprot:TRINITY_DN49878_c0_g1_i1.p1 TRINITY_DN49878_c0_g1~~TRINITY_DN49878_c0_g1_i1.p1  ORF type:complete len:410 (+),score=114.46 TRINITY_DN49878_c0_g1_i1:77-1306(+)